MSALSLGNQLQRRIHAASGSRPGPRAPEVSAASLTERARSSLVVSFANGVFKDKAAVAAAIASAWSNGQTEGQIMKLKLVKRQMYGRGKLDLFQPRVIGSV